MNTKENMNKWIVGLIGITIGLMIGVAGEYFYLEPDLVKASEATVQTQNTTPSTTTPSETPTPSNQPISQSGSSSSQTSTTVTPTQPTASTINAATVTAINGGTLTVLSNGEYYTITTGSSTNFIMANTAKTSLTQVSINDEIDVTGIVNGVTIQATQIRDLSLIPVNFTATIVSVDIANNKLTVNMGPSNQEIIIDSATIITDKNGKQTALPNLNVGDTVQVIGVWDITTNTVINVTLVKDLNIAL
jgi:hypothetical protein